MIGTEILKAELQLEKSWGDGSVCIFVMYKENWEDSIFQNRWKVSYTRKMSMEDWFMIREEFVRINQLWREKAI